MALIRTVRPDESGTYPDLAEATPERNDAARAALDRYLAAGCTRPGWCLVADEDGRAMGGVVLWGRPGRDVPTDLVMLEAAPGATGAALLDHAAALARSLGATRQGYALDAPAPPEQHHASAADRDELLTDAGFRLLRDGKRFRWTADRGLPPEPDGLRWVTVAEAGRTAAVDLMAEIIADTADSWINADIAEHGLRWTAEDIFDETSGLRHEPEWFEIGYAPDGTAAALSLPAANSSVAVLGFVGVAPGHRGHGYASAVAARGTRILAGAGAEEIRGDCDKSNPGMVRAFLRAGYDNFIDRREYQRDL